MSFTKRIGFRNALYIFSGLAFIIGFVILVRSGTLRPTEIKAAISHFDVKYLWFALLASGVQILFQILRLWILTPQGKVVSWVHVAKGFSYGQAVNAFVPLRAGDVLKVLGICAPAKNQETVTPAEATGMLVADKLVDIISFLIWCGAASFFWINRFPGVQAPDLKAQVIALAILGILGGALFYLVPHPKFRILIGRMKNGLSGLGRPKQASLALVFSLLGWCGETTALYFLMVGQGVEASFSGAIFVLGVLNLGIAVPISFANLGPFEASMIFGLGQMGIPAATALAIASAHHLIQIVVVWIWAAILWLLARLT